jgi:hypothetical protein
MGWSTKDKTKMTKPSHWVSELASVAVPWPSFPLWQLQWPASRLPFFFAGALRGLSFSESIISINTISTVGYGDIIPYSNLARLLSSLEVFCGIMLLLFGVSELLEYAREHRRDRRSE